MYYHIQQMVTHSSRLTLRTHAAKERAAWRHIKHSLGLYFRVLGRGTGSELDVESLVLVLDMYLQSACTFFVLRSECEMFGLIISHLLFL